MPQRSITTHHDGFGLNDSIAIVADERDSDGGGASHNYSLLLDGSEVGALSYQHGARGTPGSVDGLTDEAVLAVVLDRYRGFQSGPFACRENAIVITKIEEAMHWIHARARTRAAQGVLGKNAKHFEKG